MRSEVRDEEGANATLTTDQLNESGDDGNTERSEREDECDRIERGCGVDAADRQCGADSGARGGKCVADAWTTTARALTATTILPRRIRRKGFSREPAILGYGSRRRT